MLKEVGYCKYIMREKFNKESKMKNVEESECKKLEKCHICNKKYDDDVKIMIIVT